MGILFIKVEKALTDSINFSALKRFSPRLYRKRASTSGVAVGVIDFVKGGV